MKKYVYVYTADDKKFQRLDKAAKEVSDAVFCVNDLEAIAYLKENYSLKAMNVDAIVDLLNVLELDDEIYVCSPEDASIIKASFRNFKELCNE